MTSCKVGLLEDKKPRIAPTDFKHLFHLEAQILRYCIRSFASTLYRNP